MFSFQKNCFYFQICCIFGKKRTGAYWENRGMEGGSSGGIGEVVEVGGKMQVCERASSIGLKG